MRREPRLQFTKEERENPALEKPIRKADRAAARADKAQAKVPKRKVKQRTVDPETGTVTVRLQFEAKKPPSKLQQALRDAPADTVLGAEAAYAGMEADLQDYLDTYESTHSYDEYHFDLDEIGHDPYVLISILTAYHQGEWTLDEVQGTLDMLFEKQYILTERVVVETRYDSEGDPYSWYICYVTLESKDLSHLPVYIMGEEQLSMYATYMATLGNRPDLFPQSQYPNASQKEDYLDYDVPPEALEDEQFAAMLEEAEKYLGYPYVWGGSSPSTSFDCSGFVSWVINHSGWDVGRLGAQGLCNICTPVTAANAKPGDLVFFKGTYDTPGVSHCGIYVGNGMMIHAGSPISYANLNTSYWQEHLYCYGRLSGIPDKRP